MQISPPTHTLQIFTVQALLRAFLNRRNQHTGGVVKWPPTPGFSKAPLAQVISPTGGDAGDGEAGTGGWWEGQRKQEKSGLVNFKISL